jgi:multidrug transporter EmrE-like cation transporter
MRCRGRTLLAAGFIEIFFLMTIRAATDFELLIDAMLIMMMIKSSVHREN